MKGKSDNYLPVLFPSSEDLDQLVPVVMESVEGNMVIGSMQRIIPEDMIQM
ncbi:MAG: hypothetical protein JRJ15_16805 [Deltaproteobacteria bacterium]|nr:hypothetical protein [Deltaproteobacteria bacterium]